MSETLKTKPATCRSQIPRPTTQSKKLAASATKTSAPTGDDAETELKKQAQLLEQRLLELNPGIEMLKEQLEEAKKKVVGEAHGERSGQSLLVVASAAVLAGVVLYIYHGEAISKAVTKTVENFSLNI